MSFKAKLENFWYYYKTAFILGLVVVLAGVFLISELTKKVPSDLKISLISEDVLSEASINFNEALPGIVQDIDNNGDASITISRLFINDKLEKEKAEAMSQSLESQLASQSATLFIADKANYEKLIKKDAFCPLNELLDVTPYGDRVLYRGETPIALHLAGSKVLADMQFVTDDLYALVLFRRPGDENIPERVKEYENAVNVMIELMKQS